MNTKLALLTLLLVGLGITIGFIYLSPLEYYALATRGLQTYAVVIKKEPENHRFVHYSYTVNGEKYYGVGNGGRRNPDFDQIDVGQELIAFYDPINPAVSCLGSANNQFRTNLAGVFFISFVLPIVVIISLYRKGWIARNRPIR
jgi:hypothetical protein